MDLPEKVKTDPFRNKLLQQLLDAHDNAVISHEIDDFGKVTAVYDKYSMIKIRRLKDELRAYEYFKFPEIFSELINCRCTVIPIEQISDESVSIPELEKQLKNALKIEDYEACERLSNMIKKLRK